MSETSVRAIRGATTVDVDEVEQLFDRVRELLLEMMSRNDLVHDDVINILFTSTHDLVSAFPAGAARTIGFGDVPLMCATEINVPGSAPRCVRILMLVETSRPRNTIRHTYLHGAKGLRDDLPE